MTRIYEAFQLVGTSQSATATVEDQPVPESVFNTKAPEPPLGRDGIDFDAIPRHQWNPVAESLVTLARRGACVEQFRRLRSRISAFRDEFPLKTILICSGMPEEGKTFVAANLAQSLGRNGNKRVLLIDGDLRRPRLHDVLGAPAAPGLSEYLAGTANPAEVMQRDVSFKPAETAGAGGLSTLTFIPAGKCGDNNSELAANHRIEELIKRLSPHFDWIIIDASPVLVVPDAVDLARAADAVLLIARAGVTRFEEAQRTQASFGSSRILGLVLNAVRGAPRKDYYYHYYGSENTGA